LLRPLAQVSSPPAARAIFEAGASAGALFGYVPDAGLGGGVFFDVASTARGPLRPRGRASFLATTADTSLSGTLGARLVWFVVRIEGCPLGGLVAARIGVGVCASVEVGALRS